MMPFELYAMMETERLRKEKEQKELNEIIREERQLRRDFRRYERDEEAAEKEDCLDDYDYEPDYGDEWD